MKEIKSLRFLLIFCLLQSFVKASGELQTKIVKGTLTKNVNQILIINPEISPFLLTRFFKNYTPILMKLCIYSKDILMVVFRKVS